MTLQEFIDELQREARNGRANVTDVVVVADAATYPGQTLSHVKIERAGALLKVRAS